VSAYEAKARCRHLRHRNTAACSRAEWSAPNKSEAWFGVFGPAKLPDEIVSKLNNAVINNAVINALTDTRMREARGR
jgi:hypothetical protein